MGAYSGGKRLIWVLGGIGFVIVLVSLVLVARMGAQREELKASVAHLTQELKTRNSQLAKLNNQVQRYRHEARLGGKSGGGQAKGKGAAGKSGGGQAKPKKPPARQADRKPFEVAVYNEVVRKMVAAGDHHPNLSDSWADTHYETVQAESEEQARQILAKKYKDSDGYVIDDVREL